MKSQHPLLPSWEAYFGNNIIFWQQYQILAVNQGSPSAPKMWNGPTLSQLPWKWDQHRANLRFQKAIIIIVMIDQESHHMKGYHYLWGTRKPNLDGSSSSVLESSVTKESGPGGFFPGLFFSNENTLEIDSFYASLVDQHQNQHHCKIA